MENCKYSIRKKMMVILLCSTIFPLSVSMLITYIYSRSHFNQNILSYNENLMFQFAHNIENYITGISKGIYYPYSSEPMYAFLSQKQPVTYNDHSNISVFMQSLTYLSEDITRISLESTFHKIKYTYENTRLVNTDLEESSAFALTSKPFIIPTHPSDTGSNVFSMTYFMRTIPQNEPMGILSLDISLHTLETLSAQAVESPEEILSIVDSRTQTLLYSTDSDKIGLQADPDWSGILSKLDGTSGYFTSGPRFHSSIYFYEVIPVFSQSWYILKEVPASVLYSDITHLQFIYLPTYLLFIAVSTALTWQVSSRFSAPLIGLTRQMNLIKYGEPYEPVILKRNDEIGILNDTFYSMIETINDLMVKEYQLNLSYQSAQLRMLQAQLNPHFLNNSLQSLGTLALQRQSPELYSLITTLASMMNYAMDISEPLITLNREFEYAENYLIFQRQRFGSSLHYNLDFAPDTQDLMIPKMILQPMLENYFKHGFVKRPEGYFVCAAAEQEDGLLIITVENNGTSLSEENLALLKTNLDQAGSIDHEEPVSGIGLINIQTRLNLYYDHQAHLHIENKAPYGIRIQLIFHLHAQKSISDSQNLYGGNSV